MLALAGCHSTTDVRDLDKPLFGRSKPATFIIETDRAVNVRELVRIARVLRVYRQLTPSEMRAVEQQLRKAVDDLVAVELQSMQPELDKKLRAVDRNANRQQKQAGNDRAALARIVTEAAAEKKRIAQTAHEAARQRVLSRLGHELALPMPANENHSVVVFGKMNGEQFEVTSKAYEVDVTTSRMTDEAKITKTDGSKATLLKPKR